MKILIQVFILFTITSSGCTNSSKKVVVTNPGIDNEIAHAERFSLDKNNGYTILRIINPWQGAEKVSMTYYLIRRGAVIPSGIDSSKVIFVPVKKIICMSATYVAMIVALREENSIAGVSGPRLIFSENISRKTEKGLIKDVGYDANLNKEIILKISPDLIMMYGIGSESENYIGKIKELGMKVVFNADYLETDPLSRAEWIRVFGALYCKERLADSIYLSEVEAYTSLKSYIRKNIFVRPKVLLGIPFKDTWFISPGNTFISRMIADAGGEYLWKDAMSSISMPFGIENVYIQALKADFWFNPGTIKSRDEIIAIDQRLGDIPCFKAGNIYNNTRGQIRMEEMITGKRDAFILI